MSFLQAIAKFGLATSLASDTQQKALFPLRATELAQCKFIATSAGLSDFVIASIPTGFYHPIRCGAIDGMKYEYFAQDGDDWEEGYGPWNANTGTVQRFIVTESSNNNDPINFTNPPSVGVSIATNFYGVDLFATTSEAVAGTIPDKYMSPATTAAAIAGASGAGTLFRALTADASASTSSTAQPWFPSTGAVALTANTTYRFQGLLIVAPNDTTISVDVSVLFAGTATIASLRGWAIGNSTGVSPVMVFLNNTSSARRTYASASNTPDCYAWVNGILRATTAGTFIPQFKLSASVDTACTVRLNTFFELWSIGANTVTTNGTWT
jgi:hypothetical protein